MRQFLKNKNGFFCGKTVWLWDNKIWELSVFHQRIIFEGVSFNPLIARAALI